jgi:alkaline phosphatase D
VFFARQFDSTGAANMDASDGYRTSRARIQQGWRDRSVRNPVVLSGDVHRAWANELKADYSTSSSAVIGTELVCTSITSDGDGNGSTTIPNVATNPHLKFYQDRRGYCLASVTPAQVQADFRSVAKVSEHGGAVTTAKSFVILDGRPGLQSA